MSSSLRVAQLAAVWRQKRAALPIQSRVCIGLASVAGCLVLATVSDAATAPVNLGTDSAFSVLAGSTVTNTGPTVMADDLGLAPGSSITGAPVSLGSTHVDDGLAIQAQSDLVTAFTDAAGRPATPLASADLSGQELTPGVYDASSSLLFSAGSLTLNAQGDPNAVFIIQVGSSMTTGSATSVVLANGAQACNVFWQIGASATLGTNSVFAGTVMAADTITAGNGATLDGRLLAQTGAVNLDSNVITTSACANPSDNTSGPSNTGSTTTSTPGPTTTGSTTAGSTTAGSTTRGSGGASSTTSGTTSAASAATKETITAKKLANERLAKKLATERRAKKLATERRDKRLAAQHRAKRLAAQRKAHLARLAMQRRLKLKRLKHKHSHHQKSPAHPLKSPGGFTG